jgi:hypothetical protein
MPSWLESTLNLSLKLTTWQQFGLAFLLGSFTVATLSDLRRLSAQREFLEIWLIFLVAVLGLEVYDVHSGKADLAPVAVKWGLIALFSVLSLARVGVLFRLATADVAALAAAASLLTPVLVVLFYLAAKGIALVIGPLLARGKPFWPFMPVVTLATLALLVLGWLIAARV